jgi:ABC-2 type transport system permease protein
MTSQVLRPDPAGNTGSSGHTGPSGNTGPAAGPGAARAARPAAGARMSLWRLEWLRLVRTPRGIALGAVFLFFGLIEPVLTNYAKDLVGHLSKGAAPVLPPPTPASGLNSYVSEVTVIGLVVAVAVAAAAFGFDTRRGLSTFLRTRVASMWRLVAPRFAVNAAAAAAAYALGTLGAWYETSVLIGRLPVGAVLGGMGCGAVYMAFAVAVTALAASVVRSVLGTVALALGIMLVLPVASLFHAISNWLPSALVNAPVDLANGTQHLPHFLPALLVTAAAGALALAVAVRRFRSREV